MGYPKSEYSVVTMNKRWSPIYKLLRENLRDIREQSDLTQVQLAFILQKPQSYISKIESGERKMDILEVRSYCQACGIDWITFLESLEQKFFSIENFYSKNNMLHTKSRK